MEKIQNGINLAKHELRTREEDGRQARRFQGTECGWGRLTRGFPELWKVPSGSPATHKPVLRTRRLLCEGHTTVEAEETPAS